MSKRRRVYRCRSKNTTTDTSPLADQPRLDTHGQSSNQLTILEMLMSINARKFVCCCDLRLKPCAQDLSSLLSSKTACSAQTDLGSCVRRYLRNQLDRCCNCCGRLGIPEPDVTDANLSCRLVPG